jgi:hypothetical protein
MGFLFPDAWCRVVEAAVSELETSVKPDPPPRGYDLVKIRKACAAFIQAFDSIQAYEGTDTSEK